MRVLGFGTYDGRRHPRVQILLDGLSAAGDEIVEVNRPLGFSTAERVAMVQSPLTAWHFAVRLLFCWVRLAWAGRRAARRWDPEVVLVGYLGHFDVLLARLLFPRRRIVLDHLVFAGDTASDRGVDAASMKVRLLRRLDRLALRSADVIVLDTAEHAELVPARLRGRTVVAPVGAPTHWFAEPPSARAQSPLRVVFFGLFTPLQGATVIGATAGTLFDRPDIELTMIGEGQDSVAARAAAGANPSVIWKPWIEPEDLPAVVAGHDVCLGIFGTTPKALRVVPNKVFQGAAAGCAIVTSATPPQSRLLGDSALYVPPGDATALAELLRRLADDRALVLDYRQRAYRRAEDDFRPVRVVDALRARLTAP